MKILENMKIAQKIISLLLLLGAITVFVTWLGSNKLMETDTKYSSMVNEKLASTNFRSRANTRMNAMFYDSYKMLSYDGGSRIAQDANSKFKIDAEKALSDLQHAKAAHSGGAAQVDETIAGLASFTRLLERANAFSLRNQNEEARRNLIEADSLMERVFARSLVLVDSGSDAAAEENKQMTVETGETITLLYSVSIGAIIGGLALAFFVSTYGITRPLKVLQEQMSDIAGGDFAKDVEGKDRRDEVGSMAQAVQIFRENGIAKKAADEAMAKADAEQKMVVQTLGSHLSELSDGDLTTQIKADFPGDYATLKSNFNEALDKLRELIGAVGESAATIRTGSGEIAQASEDLARRTESNAASLEETAASVTQMDGRLKASAEAASRTVERADQAIATVGGGRAVADEAVQAMGRVSDSAKGIDSVIEGLDKIAFQTRVLAMNAAVEAGRAGDAGRGFAVVADLVSALAMRAEEEAKRARDQLTVTQTDIVTAVEAVTKVDGALANISGDVSQVHELLATMAADNQAQSAAITQISSAIGTMDQATQQNAAMVEETSAAARNLASEVGGLTEQASRFNVGNTAPAARQTAAPKARKADAKSYASPVKPLPAAGVAALVRADDWNAF